MICRRAVADAIRNEILDKNIKPTELAKRLGITRKSVNDFMNANNVPNDNVLVDLLKEFEATKIIAKIEII